VKSSPSWAHAVLGVALALPLAVFASIGAFSRYTADDFCWGGILRTEGFFGSQVHWYTQYSPRYAFTFLVNLTELAGPAIVPALPATAIVVWLAILTWTWRQFGLATWRSLLLGEVATLATLQTAPDLSQSLYWQTGLLTYLLPLILATFLVGWLRRDTHRWWAYAVTALVTFVAGGLSETYLIPQNVAIALALLVAVDRKQRRVHLVLALLGGIAALVAIVASPSITSRVGGTPADLWLASSAAVATAAVQIIRLVRYFPHFILLAVAAPALLGPVLRVNRSSLVIVTIGVLVTLPFCYFPSFYAQNGNPPSRSLIVPGAILIGYLLFWGVALHQWTPRWVAEPRRAIALTALALIPLATAAISLPQQGQAATYARLFDAEDQQIRASRDAGQTDLLVPALPTNLGEDFVTANRGDWFNMCVARYYGVGSIATSSS
jgi:hypothetical protein